MSTIKVNALRHTGGSSDNVNLDSSARVLIGTSSSRSVSGSHSKLQIEATDSSGRLSIVQNRNDASGAAFLSLGKSRGSTNGSNTILQSGDTIGTISFAGTDGSGMVESARITALVDSTPGSNDMPGRLSFSTTADGSSSPTEAVRIDSSQNLRFNSGYGSVATAYGVRAWVNFNGRNTLSIYDDGGITSITDNGTGDYTVNFDFTMPDINYAFTGSASYAAAQSSAVHTVELRGNTARSTSKTTTSIRHDVVYSDGSQNRTRFDYDEISIVYFR